MSKATKAQVEARTRDILRILLDGAEPGWDICEFVREQERQEGSVWHVGEGQPLSYSQVMRYVQKAENLIRESCRTSRKKLIRRHEAMRRALYAKAVSQGDIRAAVTVLKDLADLQGVYPPKRREVSGAGGGPVRVTLEDLLDGGPSHEPDDAGAEGRSGQVP
jgi:hypothetical protein